VSPLVKDKLGPKECRGVFFMRKDSDEIYIINDSISNIENLLLGNYLQWQLELFIHIEDVIIEAGK
tara:strand:- start:726 stop:923 length:198 start_codon:yes stop_codon:yes gene_type:complete